MGYRIEDCSGTPGEIEELSRFLADFVASGEGPEKDVAGNCPETWASRLRWWWVENPFCQEDSPKGLLLRCEDGSIGGFFGFIPHDYVASGERVPSLISTTTFVSREHRDAAAGLFFRAHRLRNEYQIVDGGPNEQVRAMLRRVGYESAGRASVYFYPVRRRNRDPISFLLRGANLATPRAGSGLEGGKVVTRLDDVGEVPRIEDSRLRRQIDRDVLAWYLASGTKPKSFIGWCDEQGVLRCYLIGEVKKKKGFTFLLLTDAAAFDRESEQHIGELIAHVAREPESTRIPGAVQIVAWPSEETPSRCRSPLSVRYDANLFYLLPSNLKEAERLTFPFEGDRALL